MLGAAVAAAFVLVSSGGISTSRLRDAIEPAGAWGPLVFVGAGALLTCALFPGPVMAAAAGLLFGAWGGTGAAIATSTLGGVLAFLIARHLARAQVAELLGTRLAGVRGWVSRRGFVAVALTRIAPGLPNTSINYAMGLTDVRLAAFAAGITVGWGPKAFAYAALGGSLSNLGSPEAIAALVVLVVMGAAGSTVVGRDIRAARAARAG